MELFLIRHGQSMNNANPGQTRHHDPGLTEIGSAQAERLAAWGKTAGLTKIVASPFLRALQTAEFLRNQTGAPAEVWVDIHEQGGCCTGPDPLEDLETHAYQGQPGMTDAEIRAQYPHFQLPVEIDHRGWWQSHPFESMAEARSRAAMVVDRAKNDLAHTDDRIAVVCHGMLKLLVLDTLFGGYVLDENNVDVPYNTSVSRVVMTPSGVELDYYNGVPHLSEELLTV